MTSREDIYACLNSFDPEGMADAEWEAQALTLLRDPFTNADAFYEAFVNRTPREVYKPLDTLDMDEVDALLAGVYSFYGEVHELGPDFSWDHNPGTAHWGHDLNRFGFILKLTSAAMRTGEQKYRERAAALIMDWVAKNDVCDAPQWDGDSERSPYAWSSYLNIAIHLIQWTSVIDEVVSCLTPRQLLAVVKSIHDQMRWLERVIPQATNNWVIIGARGLMETTVRMPELRDSDRIMAFAWERFEEESSHEVLADGMQFELTQCYHMLVLTFLVRAMELYRLAGNDVPATMEKTASAMTDYAMQIITPAGKALAFNDSDPDGGERFMLFLEEEGRRKERADWLYVGTGGREGRMPGLLSQAFTRGGVYIMRTGWDADAVYLAFDGGPWGKSHQHNDRLSFQFNAFGRAFIVDPGRYLYDWSNPYRPYLLSTHAHSTITVDNQSQADRFFPATHVPGPELSGNIWVDDGNRQRAVSAHILGYGEEGKIVVQHRRAISFRHPDLVLVVDRVTGEGTHAVASRLQLAPGDVLQSGGVWHTTFGDADLAVLPWMSLESETVVEKGLLEPHVAGWYSDGINKIEPSPTLVTRAEGDLPLRALYLLVPYRGGDLPDLVLDVDGDTVSVTVNGRTLETTFSEELEGPLPS